MLQNMPGKSFSWIWPELYSSAPTTVKSFVETHSFQRSHTELSSPADADPRAGSAA